MSNTQDSNLFFSEAHRQRILDHMNEDHADAVLRYVIHFGKVDKATEAILAGIDRDGIDVDYHIDGRKETIRIPFAQSLESPEDAHMTLVHMARESKEAAIPDGRNNSALTKATEVVREMTDAVKTVILGTVSEDGEPDASVAPAVIEKDHAIYVYVSELAMHTRNMVSSRRASVFLVEDESESKNLLARRRLTFSCQVEEVPRTDACFDAKLDELKEKFGPVMNHLKSMLDFRLFRLQPVRGRLVIGFGQAYTIDPKDWTELSHVNDVGHVRER